MQFFLFFPLLMNIFIAKICNVRMFSTNKSRSFVYKYRILLYIIVTETLTVYFILNNNWYFLVLFS